MTIRENTAPPVRRSPWRTVRNALVLAATTLKLSFRDRRAFFFSLVFPMAFLFMFGLLAAQEGPEMLRVLIARVVGLTIMTGSFFGQGMGLAVQRERGMLRRYRLTPLGASGLLGGTALAGLVVVGLTIAIQLMIWQVQFDASLSLSPLPFLAAAVVSALAMASLGLVIAAVASTMQEAQILFQITFLVSILLSDLSVPLDLFPPLVRRLAVFLPATHMTALLHSVFTGEGLSGAGLVRLFALALMAVSAFAVAARLFRWERDDPLSRRARLSALLALLPVIAFGLWQNARGVPASQFDLDPPAPPAPALAPADPSRDLPSLPAPR